MTSETSQAQAARGLYRIGGQRLRGLVAAVPSTPTPNAFFEQRFSADEISETARMIGVHTRYWASASQTTADLCFLAADELLRRLDWERSSIDAVVFVSQTPDHPLPATACILQHRLGLPKTTAAFDVGLGCSGYVYGLWLCSALMAAGCRRILLLAGDTSSRFLDKDDSGTAMVFGDAGSATAMESDSSAPDMFFAMGSDGKGGANLVIPQGWRNPEAASDRLFMNGFEVFSFTLNSVPPLIKDVLGEAGRSIDDIDYFVLHQANAFMLKHIAKKLKVGMDKVPINIDRFGNTSSASIPLLLASDLGEPLSTGMRHLVLAGFGAGYSWGACVIEDLRLACVGLLHV